jgi:pimeloyl-ACP methyl ester carboxylesterase
LVAAPVTVIGGEADQVVAPELCRQLAGRLNGRLLVLPDTGQQIPWQAPDAVLSRSAK